MATARYIWERYTAKKDAFSNHGTAIQVYLWSTSNSSFSVSPYPPSVNGNQYTGGSDYQISQNATILRSVSTYGKYLYTKDILCVFPDSYGDSEGYQWAVSGINQSGKTTLAKSGSQEKSFDTYKAKTSKGDYVDTVFSDSKTKYKEGYDGSYYWYVYKQYEYFDPYDIHLTTTKIIPGKTATAVVSAYESAYGGITYHVSYSVNGGPYQSLSPQAGTTFTFTIPDHAESIQLRVYAESSGGITSNTVYSTTYYANEAPSAPPSVSIPAAVYSSDPFPVSWGAATDPDGNLSGYEVQMSYNGGSSWSDVTTAVSTSIITTVEYGMEIVQYRVRACDSKGEYSGWTYSNTAVIRNLRAYVGVNGKARKVDKLYVGVNGKARQVVKGYIGVNGKARKFL